jgi:hypothetical protein
MIEQYRRIEPYVSLNPDKTLAREEYADREKGLRQEFENRLAKLEAEMRGYLHRQAAAEGP